jgi:hypothetical protein
MTVQWYIDVANFTSIIGKFYSDIDKSAKVNLDDTNWSLIELNMRPKIITAMRYKNTFMGQMFYNTIRNVSSDY